MSKTVAVVSFLAACVLSLGSGQAQGQSPAPAEPDELGTRGLWDTFDRARPEVGGKSPTPRPARVPRAASDPAPTTAQDLIGITLWRVRPVQPGDEPFSVIALGGDKQGVAVRIAAGDRLREGEQVRLTVETPRRGYLYVIDRETYADGRRGEPVLVFPTTRLNGGENALSPGTVFGIPDLHDSPPVFKLTRSRPDHVGEGLSILVSPAPIAEVRIGPNAQALPEALVAKWEAAWGVKATMRELPGAAGRPTSLAEQQAGTGARALLHGEPLPQVLYQVAAKANAPIMIQVDLAIGAQP